MGWSVGGAGLRWWCARLGEARLVDRGRSREIVAQGWCWSYSAHAGMCAGSFDAWAVDVLSVEGEIVLVGIKIQKFN